jgi:hypothetical protein
MRRTETKTQTFQQILQRLEAPNAERLLEKACTANRLAKSAPDSSTRRSAYRIKTEALLILRRRFPARTSVKIDPRIPSFVIVQYSSLPTGARCGLHAPAHEFAC